VKKRPGSLAALPNENEHEHQHEGNHMAVAQPNTNSKGKGRMEFKKVDFDVHEIAPDAPKGEWDVSIPRGKCKVLPTKEEHYPMLIVPIRLDKTDEEGETFEKALGTELSVMIVFFGNEKARGARMAKLKLTQLCEAADVDLDVVPKSISSGEDIADLVNALEGKKFKAWTTHRTRSDTGETLVDVHFKKPGGLSAKGITAEDDEEDEEEEDKPRAAKGGKGKTTRR
jgi:hypothetical protein